MTCKLFILAVVAVAVLTPFTLGTCPPKQTVGCNIIDLCGKTTTVKYQAGFDSKLSCIVSQFLCNQNQTVTMYTHSFVNGYLEGTLMTQLTAVAPGIAKRVYLGSGKVRTEYTAAYESYPDGSMKLASIQCAEGEADPTQVVIISNYDADLTSELKEIQGIVLKPDLIKMPNKCSP